MPRVELPPHHTRTLLHTRHGSGDPTCRFDSDVYSRAMLTPEGPGVLVVRFLRDASSGADVAADGPARDWILAHHREMLGLEDHPPAIRALHPPVEEARRRFGDMRLARTCTPYQDLLVAVLGQRITAIEAVRQWRRLVLRHGRTAPWSTGLVLPPEPEVLVGVPYFELHELGVERRRADALRRVAEHSDRLLELADTDMAEPAGLTASLARIPGVGAWTAAVAGGMAFGDADALRVGDFHVKNTVAWALAGRPRGTDEEMLQLMEPYSGQRERVVRWLQAANWRAPRFGPGRRIVDIARF